MKLSRRQLLKTVSFSAMVVALSPRIVFAASNSLKSIRTGLQPGGKSRIVIETANRPSYNLSYGEKLLTISLSNTTGKSSIKPKIADGTIIKRIVQIGESSLNE